jgi:hypothetical protein
MQASSDAGFRLPGEAGTTNSGTTNSGASGPATDPANGTNTGTGTGTGVPVVGGELAGAPQIDTSARDLTLGGGIFFVLLLAFFFARGAYVNHLVARRVAPSSAGSAGWLLFVGLSFFSAAVVLALINSAKYLSFGITVPLVLVGLATLVGAVLVGRR